MEEGEALPDHQRCRRNDGRQWRCVRRVMDNKKYCELHYLQARHRHYKQKVPDSMKLQRKSGSKRTGKEDSELQNLEIRAKKPKKLAKILKKRRSVGVSEALDKALKKMKLKKGDLQLELIRMFLQRQMERKKKRSSEKITEGDLMRDLPNGLMAISQAPLQHCGNAGFFCERKLGLNSGSFMRRCFRSKNIEPFHISSLQIFPYRRNVANLRRGGKKNCHRCQRSNARSFVQCSSCRMEFFCIDCINEWYSDIREEVKMACPVCRGTCNCKTCLTNQSKDGGYKELLGDQNKVNKIPHLHYLVCLLLPVLKQINQDQRIELEIQAKLEGKAPSDIHIQQAECSYYEQLCCDNCKTSIVDVHRSCSNCSYDLCLLCSWEIHRGTLPGGTGAAVLEYSDKRKTYVHGDKPLAERHQIGSLGRNPVSAFLAPSATLPDWKGYYCNGCISCPPKELGGCGDGILDLRCIFPLNWTKELEISAEEIVCSYDFPENLDVSSHCSSCTGMHDKAGNRTLREAATRENSEDNYLYCPTVLDIQDENLEHFQKHWIKGQPVIVRNVLQDTSDFSWDPVVMFCTSLKRSSIKPENGKNAANAADCLDWSEVEIGTHQFFKGYLEGQMHPSLWPEILRFKDRPSPNLFQEQFPAHNAEFIRALPFQEYMNPNSGLLNLAVKLPKAFLKPDLGPHVYISHGVAEELEWGDSVTKLYYESSDVVNILVHTIDIAISPEQCTKLPKLKNKSKAQDEKKSLRTAMDQKMVSEVKQELSMASQNMSEAGSGETPDATWWTHLSKGFGGVSSFSTVMHEECGIGVKDEKMLHAGEYFSTSVAPKDCCRTIQRFANSGDEKKFCQGNFKSTSGIGKKVVAKSCGAKWDVFRREDVPKLKEYLRRHSNEFSHTYGSPVEHVAHPILDEGFYLDTTHKRRLKEEFEVEPWNFDQHIGEAVIIPAGCPYQIWNLKSCVNVVLDFVSPENVTNCIQLIDELRLLPKNHKAKEGKLEVKKMSLYGIDAAIKEIHDLISTSTWTGLKEKT